MPSVKISLNETELVYWLNENEAYDYIYNSLQQDQRDLLNLEIYLKKKTSLVENIPCHYGRIVLIQFAVECIFS